MVARMCWAGRGGAQGKDTIKFLEKLVVADIGSIPDGFGSLSVLTNEKGGCIDDTVITKVTAPARPPPLAPPAPGPLACPLGSKGVRKRLRLPGSLDITVIQYFFFQNAAGPGYFYARITLADASTGTACTLVSDCFIKTTRVCFIWICHQVFPKRTTSNALQGSYIIRLDLIRGFRRLPHTTRWTRFPAF